MSSKINEAYKGIYHFTPPHGWLNDPNGIVFFKGRYHLFYQYHPYSAEWGPMHWGHAVSNDLIKWEHLPIALTPDMPYDKNGCWSGSAVVKDDKLYLIYTGISRFNVKTQCLAFSDDGVNFVKYKNNPIIKASLVADKNERRDPYVWKHDEMYYCLLAANGCASLYISNDLINWKNKSKIAKDTGKKVLECPCLAQVENSDVLIASPVNFPQNGDEFKNYSSNIWSVGKMDYNACDFSGSEFEEIDRGTDFYAARCAYTKDGMPILIAWMNMWDRRNVLNELSHGWCGVMTLPRELEYLNGRLLQKPISAIENYYKNEISVSDTFSGEKDFNGICGRSVALKINCNMQNANWFSVKLFNNGENYLEISYNKSNGMWSFDTRNTLYPTFKNEKENGARNVSYKAENNILNFEIFLDRSSAEIFIANGEITASMLCFNPIFADGITFAADGIVNINIVKHDIIL